MPTEIIVTFAILILAITLFVTEIIPVAMTALLTTFLLYITGVIDTETVFSGFTNEIVILIAGMFIIGSALFETGVARSIGDIITKYAKTEKQLLLAIMIVASILSAFLSNTSTTAVMMPIVVMIADSVGFTRSKLLMPLAYATSFGGMITLVGNNGTLAAQGVAQNQGVEGFGFFEFAYIGVPLTIIGIIYMMTIGYKVIPNRENKVMEEPQDVKTEKPKKQESSTKQFIAVATLIVTIIFMIFEEQIGIPLHIVSIMGALLVVLTRTMTEKQAYRSLDMSTLILVAAMMPMATAMEDTGAAKLFADSVLSLVGDATGPYIMTALIFLITTFLTSVMSNTATAVLMAPIGIVIATSMGADPRPILMTIAVGSAAAYASPIGTPPNTMIYKLGNYKFIDYVKSGLPFIIIQLIICTFIVPWIWPFY
ncbi:MAG TPA: SLC13 family permease [Virgibacillus sp.]|nr:SLC13 family permease [Virgibacillus sp.]HLR68855.1 SLC13 family permease [Virgibacillus sp.]